MTKDTANKVAERLNELNVPTCAFEDPLGQMLSVWSTEGGRLVVVNRPGEEQVIKYYFPHTLAQESEYQCDPNKDVISLDNTKFGRWSA